MSLSNEKAIFKERGHEGNEATRQGLKAEVASISNWAMKKNWLFKVFFFLRDYTTQLYADYFINHYI